MFREGLRPPDPFRERPPLEAARTQDDLSVAALSRLAPVVAVCLPDGGGRGRWLAAAGKQRAAVERAGARLVLVHAADLPRAALDPHDLAYAARVHDPDRKLYAALGLAEQAPGLWKRLTGGGAGPAPGAFVIRDGEVVHAARTPRPPDLAALLRGEGEG